ncbi:hypothetical protein EJ08DRAFT_670896 [Tothia fuscella]|uniref:Uncharacterized protein n=1 Tax=Tothia fuscella TaxID=1048955 RepID=A0A9P4NQR2_9PEZI|nr:hypothetical protein EJ08DRAFT_670896 [Tothia fuscella]
MASRILSRAMRQPTLTKPNASTPFRRSFQTTSKLSQETVIATPTPLPVKKPVGAFRGGLLGFLLGATGAGAGMYYYVLGEYRVSNELLTEDIYNLQATVQRIESYVRVLEDKVDTAAKKK